MTAARILDTIGTVTLMAFFAVLTVWALITG